MTSSFNTLFRRQLRFVTQACIALWPSFLGAQGIDLRGTISDSLSRQRIAHAIIMLEGTRIGVSSNLQGFYVLVNVPPGEYNLVASSIGYHTSRAHVVVRTGDAISLDFLLAPNPVQMTEVLVTDNPRRQLAHTQTSFQTLERTEIRAVPMTGQEDIFRHIAMLPGVVSTSDVSSQFYVRGGAGDQNLVLLDGMKVYNPYHAFGVYGAFDADILKSVEVYTGAFPAKYGGRLSSVVNILTRDGGERLTGRANINFVSGKLQAEGPLIPGVSWIVTGRKSLFHNTLRRFFAGHVPISFHDVLFKVTGLAAGVQGKFDVQWFDSGDDLTSPRPDEPDYSWRSSAYGFAASGLVHDRSFVDVVAYRTVFEGIRDSKSSTTVTAARSRVAESTIRANATFYTDSRDLYFFGFDFSFPTLDNAFTNTGGIPQKMSQSFLEAGIWSHYQGSIGRMRGDLGLYFDVGSLIERAGRFEVIQPRVSLSYEFAPTWLGKFAYGRHTQNLVTINNEDDVISIFDAWIQVPREIRSERADHFVLGIEGNALRNFSTGAQLYHKSFGSLVAYNRDKINAADPDYVQATGRASGMELLGRYGSETVDIFLSYALAWTTITNAGLIYAPRYDRRHTLNLLVTTRVLENLSSSVHWGYGSGLPFTQTKGYFDRLPLTDMFREGYVHQTGEPYTLLAQKNAARLPAYHRLDIGAEYRLQIQSVRVTVGLSIANVSDRRNIFYFDRRTGQTLHMIGFFPSASLTLEY